MTTYFVLKAVHIAGVVLMLGNVTVTGFWAGFMYRRTKALGLPFKPVAQAILWTDWVFTLVGGTAITISGTAMILVGKIALWQSPWLLKGIAALSLSTLAWLIFLLPDQFRLERATDPAEIRRHFTRWNIVGWTSTALLFYALWCMVVKQ